MSVILIAIGVMGLSTSSASNEALRSVYEDRTVSVGEVTEINRLMLRTRLDIANSVLDPTPEQIFKNVQDLDAALSEADKQWKNYSSRKLATEEGNLAQQFAMDREKLLTDGFKPAVEALRQRNVDLAHQIIIEKIRPSYVPVAKDIDALIKLQFDSAKNEYFESKKRYDDFWWISIGMIALGVLSAEGFGYLLIKSIRSSLAEALQITESVASGDLSKRVEVSGQNEVATLLRGLLKMQDSLAQVVGVVRRGAYSVASSSAEIAQGNQDLSNRTESQASALEETASSMEQLGSQIKHNAESAQAANRLANDAAKVATRGGEVVSMVVDTMQEINESSRKIGDIIGVIDSIAFQTNILALNAAVEAARAGEQGRGFAVVAQEVRSLASRSAEAAREIKRLIYASVERVEHGTTLVDQAGSTMDDIVKSIQRVNDLMGEISSASKEQAQGVSQVSEAVNQMDQFTQQNAALVEESAAGAGALEQQAREMVNAVAIFKLAEEESPVAPRASVRSSLTPSKTYLGVERREAGDSKSSANPITKSSAVVPKSPTVSSVEGGSEDWETF